MIYFHVALVKSFFQLPFLFYDATFSFNHQYIIYITYNISYIIYYDIYRPSHVRWSSLIDTLTTPIEASHHIINVYQHTFLDITPIIVSNLPLFLFYMYTCQCNLIHPRGYPLAKAMPAKLLGIFRVLPPPLSTIVTFPSHVQLSLVHIIH